MGDDYREPKFQEDFTGDSYAIENKQLRDDPIDKIEPLVLSPYDQGYRDACKKYIPTLDAALSIIHEADDYRVALYQIAFALGLPFCAGKSMEAVATKLGVTRACISKGAKQYIDGLNLPPSQYMRTTLACMSYANARIERIKRQRNKPKDE